MDPNILAELAKLGTVPCLMGLVIVAQYRENKQLREDFEVLRNKWQDKYDALIQKTIESIGSATNQTNLFSVTLNTLVQAINKLDNK